MSTKTPKECGLLLKRAGEVIMRAQLIMSASSRDQPDAHDWLPGAIDLRRDISELLQRDCPIPSSDPEPVAKRGCPTRAAVFTRFGFEAFHRWPDAPDEADWLRDRHKHVLNVKAWVDVERDDHGRALPRVRY